MIKKLMIQTLITIVTFTNINATDNVSLLDTDTNVRAQNQEQRCEIQIINTGEPLNGYSFGIHACYDTSIKKYNMIYESSNKCKFSGNSITILLCFGSENISGIRKISGTLKNDKSEAITYLNWGEYQEFIAENGFPTQLTVSIFPVEVLGGGMCKKLVRITNVRWSDKSEINEAVKHSASMCPYHETHGLDYIFPIVWPRVIYKNNDFIMCSQTNARKESYACGNTPDLEEISQTLIQDGKLIRRDECLVDTEGKEWAYVSNGIGNIFTINNREAMDGEAMGMHHSYFLKSHPGDVNYGIGQDVSCAGNLKITAGKLIEINTISGHYTPNYHQIILLLQHLAPLGCVDDNLSVVYHDGTETKTAILAEITCMDKTAILSQYQNKEIALAMLGDLKGSVASVEVK